MSDVETVTSPFRFVSGSRQMNSKHSSNEETTLEHITQVINELNFTLGKSDKIVLFTPCLSISYL